MATILLNGVVTDASSLSPSELSDKLTVSGGVDGLSVDLAGGDDAVEIYADSENVTGTQIRVSEGDDRIDVLANSGVDPLGDADQFAGLPLTLGDSLIGGQGDDTIMIDDGLVQLAGAVKGNEGEDLLDVSNIIGGTVNGNAGDDTIDIGDTGGLADDVGERGEAAVTNGSVMGGSGNDTIEVDADVTGSAVRGNEGDDSITISGEFSGTNTINGNAGDDVIDTTDLDSAVIVIGGKGNDIFRAGNGQTLRGGLGADTYSVETTGGVTIDRFDRLDYDGDTSEDGADEADCFCDDVIQVDGNKIEYDTYEYKLSLVDHTSASSWLGNIKVKAVVEGVAVGTNTTFSYKATKTETINATAVLAYKVSDLTSAALPLVNYPATGFIPTVDGGKIEGLDNGNEPRVPFFGTQTPLFSSGRMVESRGFGFASATGYWRTQNATNGGRVAIGSIRSALVYTRTAFDKGDFSFLELTAKAGAGEDGSQKLVFDDVSNATITNHWRSYNKEKTTNATSLYALSFGTANFGAVVTGRANLLISDGIADQTFIPTEGQLLGDLAAWNFTGTGWTRQVTAKAGATITLDLDGTFDAWVRRNSGTLNNGSASRGGVLTTTADGVQWSFHNNITWAAAGTRGLRTLSVATSIFGPINTTPVGAVGTTGGPNSQLITNQGGGRFDGTFKQQPFKQVAAQTAALNTNYSSAARLQTTFIGANNAIRETAIATGSLVVKIAVTETDVDAGAGGLAGAVSRAVIPGQEFDITSCSFPTTIYGNRGDTRNNLNRHNLVTEAVAVTFSGNNVAAGEFNTRYLWNAGDMRGATAGRSLAEYSVPGTTTTTTVEGETTITSTISYPIADRLNFSNGCTSFSCETPATAGEPNGPWVTGLAALALNTGEGENNGFFSGSEWSVDVLAAAGMGDNVTVRNPDANDTDTLISTAVGAPFRVLFFDTEGADNGLYIYSGTANYKAGDVTAINTNPTPTTSAFGGKETIVRATVKDGGSALALSDINFV